MAAQQQQQLMTAAQLASMSPSQQQAYLASLDPATAAQEQASLTTYKQAANAAYLAHSVRRQAYMPPAAGGVSQNYVAGQTLVYNFPTVSGGFARDIIIKMALTLTNAAGTSAVYGLTAGAPYSLFNEIQIQFNGMQARIRPYMLKIYEMARSRQNPLPGAVPSNGNAQAAISSVLSSGGNTNAFGVAVGANTWNLEFRIPLNALHELSPAGMLPIQGSATKPQLLLIANSALVGPDPLLNVEYAVSGTGQAITVAGTVTCFVDYNDGTNMTSPNPLSLDLAGVPTAQWIIETPLTPLAAGIVQRQRIATLLQHYYVVSVVIDGNQSNAFALASNFNTLELDQDSVGQNKFWQYGPAANNTPYEYFEYIRHVFQQDFDAGVIPWVIAESFDQENPDNRMGNMALNMMQGGWTDVHHGYILNSVNGLGTVTPRVETYLISLNPAGLLIQ